MPHREYVRLVDGAETAVLFLHGIVGTPRHFDSRLPLIPLVPEDWSVYSLLLPGHGGAVEDFAAATMHSWKEYVWKIFDDLSQTHRHVVLVGHSMGTLFALQLAIEKGEKVPLLFLLASPICPQFTPAAISHCLDLVFPSRHGDHKIRDAMSASGSVTLTKKLWKYIPWLPNMFALLLEARMTKRLLPQLRTKTIVFQSRKDELVAHRSEKFLVQCPTVHLSVLEDSTHFYYTDADTRLVQQAFLDACKEVSQ